MPDALWGGGRGHATAADTACAINGALRGGLGWRRGELLAHAWRRHDGLTCASTAAVPRNRGAWYWFWFWFWFWYGAPAQSHRSAQLVLFQ